MFQFYISKLNKKTNRLWQKPHQGTIFYVDEYWYEGRHVGHDQLNSFMKILIKEAGLAGENYTNHSIRSTCITTLDKSGFEARHITAISSHKSESTIKTYSTKCPENKKKEMYEALNKSVIPKKRKIQETNPSPLKEQDLPTINYTDIANLNTNNNNNKGNLPANFQLIPFESDEEDDFLLDYLKKHPEDKLLDIPVTKENNQVTTNNTTMMSSMPLIPKMYFPNSNVTINYNFLK